MKVLRIPDWGRLQHYKTRSAPWVKSYRTDLIPGTPEGESYLGLSLAARGLLADLQRLAVECGNAIPCTPDWIAFKLGTDEPLAPLLDELLAKGRLQLAPDAISPAIKDASIGASTPSHSPASIPGKQALSRSLATGEGERARYARGEHTHLRASAAEASSAEPIAAVLRRSAVFE